jgi:hypothetical protein
MDMDQEHAGACIRARLTHRFYVISMPASPGNRIREPRPRTGRTSRGPLPDTRPGPACAVGVVPSLSQLNGAQ